MPTDLRLSLLHVFHDLGDLVRLLLDGAHISPDLLRNPNECVLGRGGLAIHRIFSGVVSRQKFNPDPAGHRRPWLSAYRCASNSVKRRLM
jgi:hypothetical protein